MFGYVCLTSQLSCLLDYHRKRQQLENVTTVAVRNDTVCTMGEGLAAIASHLLEIDLQDNLIWDWQEVNQISWGPF